MTTSKNPYLAPSVAAFIALAIVCAGAGGLVSTEASRNLFAAGSGFWLLMLLVPAMFISRSMDSHLKQSALFAAYGAIGGLCAGLCFFIDEGWSGVLTLAAGSGFLGFVGYWASYLRSVEFWRNVWKV
jgi:hypothetical protein